MQTQEWTKIYRWGEGKRKIYLRIQKKPQKTNQPTTHLFVITGHSTIMHDENDARAHKTRKITQRAILNT